MEESRTEGHDAPATGAPKRPASSTEGPRRPKRGKYTPVACDGCKKRKLKCIPAADEGCERCVAGGLACVYASGPPPAAKQRHESSQDRSLSDDMAQLRQQVADLVDSVKQLKDSLPRPPSVAFQSPDVAMAQSPSTAKKDAAPKQPQFVGPTRPSFGIMVGERSLTRMGIPTFESPPPSGAQSPAETPRELTSETEFWLHCTRGEMVRLLAIFEEEVESVYPFINIAELASEAQQILDLIRSDRTPNGETQPSVSARDIDTAKIAIATGLAVEAHGKTHLSATIAESVERRVSRISSPQVELKEIQLLAMLSIYYFHCDEELLAWRTIGIAAREALEMGLHRKKSLYDNFKDPEARRLATRVFWCVYVLDRRWSFGTSLSFALSDRDIDPGLPEPNSDFCYLKCMVGYGRLCSQLWNAIPPLGSASQSIPDETVRVLDLNTQKWLESIPSHLRLRHPRLGLPAQTQPRLEHRLRTLLYLRGNHARISIYQHYLFSATSITANLQSAWLVVNVALDSVHILVHLNATTDIYSRQQKAFNYFLIGAIAVIFLAVCHAPTIFTEPCRSGFLDAVDLVRGFSRHSLISRRLWKSIRGLLPRLRSLGLQSSDGSSEMGPVKGGLAPGNEVLDVSEFREALQHPARTDPGGSLWDAQTAGEMMAGIDITNSIPDMCQMRNDLLDLFDALGQGQQFLMAPMS